MILQLNKFGDSLSSRPAGREAALVCLAYEKQLRTETVIELDFSNVFIMTPSWLSEFVQTLQENGIEKITYLPSDNPSVLSSIQFIEDETD